MVAFACGRESEYATRSQHDRNEGKGQVNFRTGRKVMAFAEDVHIGPMGEQGSSERLSGASISTKEH